MNEHTLNERLAAEFLELKGEFPEFLEYGNLPAEVRKAAEGGRDLMSALLLHRHKEEKAAAKAREQAAAAAKATAGSLSGESNNETTDVSEFKKGLWG
jgi:protein involved in temperature-dependent protein secretion